MEQRRGLVTHYYNHLGVAVIKLTGTLKLGDEIHLGGRKTEFSQIVRSLEIDQHKVVTAGAGMEVALQVLGRVRKGDSIYLVKEVENLALLIP